MQEVEAKAEETGQAARSGLPDAIASAQPLEGTAQAGEIREALEELLRLYELKLAPSAQGADLPAVLVVAGGTNVGKTTISNAITGARLGTPTGLARATKHAVAYLHKSAADALRASGFPHGFALAPLEDLEAPNRESDGDALQLWLLEHEDAELLDLAILDCPDIDSVAVHNRTVARELAYASDALLMVTSEEKYNDEVCVRFLRRAVELHKRTLVVLNKNQSDEVTNDLRTHVLTALGARAAPALFTVPAARPAEREAEIAQATRALREAVGALAGEAGALRAAARKGAQEALAAAARFPLGALREERAALEGYREALGRLADDAAHSYRRSIEDLEVIELQRALKELGEALKVPVLDDIYDRLRNATEPVHRRVLGFLGIGPARDKDAERAEQRDREDQRLARLELGRALSEGRALAGRFSPALRPALEAALLPTADGEALAVLDERYRQGLRDLSASWIDETVRELHEMLREHPRRFALMKGIKALIRGGAMSAVLMTGSFGLENVLAAPVVDMAVSKGSQAIFNKAYFVTRASTFLDRRAKQFRALVRERLHALALERLPDGPSSAAIAALEASVRELAGEGS